MMEVASRYTANVYARETNRRKLFLARARFAANRFCFPCLFSRRPLTTISGFFLTCLHRLRNFLVLFRHSEMKPYALYRRARARLFYIHSINKTFFYRAKFLNATSGKIEMEKSPRRGRAISGTRYIHYISLVHTHTHTHQVLF